MGRDGGAGIAVTSPPSPPHPPTPAGDVTGGGPPFRAPAPQ